MYHDSPPGGPLDERAAIYRHLVGEDPFDAAARAAADDEHEREGRDDDEPTAFACLGCGAVTTADEPPESCPECHRTPGDRGDAALFQSLE
jgi:rubrerythrin